MKKLLILLLFTVVFAADIKEIISDKQKELQNIQQKMLLQKSIINKTEKQAKDVYNNIKLIEADLERKNRDHVKVAGAITKTKTDIGVLEVQIVQEKSKFNIALDSLKDKLDKYYRLNNTNFIENIFEIKNLTDYLNEVYFFETMVSDNVVFLNDVREKKIKLSNDEGKLSQKLGDLKIKEDYIVTIKEQIKDNKQKKEKLYDDLLAQKKEYEKQLRELERDSREVQQLIAKFQRTSKSSARMGDGTFIWPVIGQITSPFGERVHPIFKIKAMHTGLDISAPSGRPIFAAGDGVVIFSGYFGGYGKAVIIDHGASITTLYGHMSQYFVKKDVPVKKGQIIGLVGSTGWSTGPHCHFEVRVDGQVKDPTLYLPNQ